MSSTGTVVVRRTWPQRIVILCSVAVIVGAIGAAWFLNDVYEAFSDLGRVEFAADVLITDTDPGDPVNYLLIGEDSAEGLDPDDPAAFARDVDSRGRFQADSIVIVRVNPTTGQAWVVSLPRDLLVDDRGTERKINSLLLVEDAELLVKTIQANFGITLNHFISLDFLGFREIVDELGGIPVWFENPARDQKPNGENASGLLIETAGCHVLTGEQALQYVRSRNYRELIDGEWQYVGNSDFGRIRRQQDFLVLALERAIDRGARDPAGLASLIEAAASSLVLDDELTVAELVDVGEAFSNFNPENLERFELQVTTIFDGDVYRGERVIPEVNEPVFSVFRGSADLVGAEDVTFDLYGPEADQVPRIADELEGEGFAVAGRFALPAETRENVVVYPTGQRRSAETIARYLEPIPRLVEDTAADTISLVLGERHEQVLIFFPHEVPKMRAAVAAFAEGDVPDLTDAVRVGAAPETTTTTVPGTTTTTPPSTTSSSTTSSSTTSSPTSSPTTTVGTDDLPVPEPTTGIIGRPPEGQSCG